MIPLPSPNMKVMEVNEADEILLIIFNWFRKKTVHFLGKSHELEDSALAFHSQ